MKRALLVLPLLLVLGCSDSDQTTAPPSPTPSATTGPTASPTATPSATPPPPRGRPAPVGPAGTAVPKGFTPSSATFVSDTTGWVLGDSPCPTGTARCDVVARTRDGGRTWRAIPAPRTSPDNLAQIRFADERNGFVTGTELWATHDGGATWRVVPGLGDVTELAASAGRVWLVKGEELSSAPAAGGPFVVEPLLHPGALAVRGQTAVLGSTRNGNLQVGRHGGPFRTVRTPCAEEERPSVGLAARHWLLVCAGEAGLGHEEKRAFRSADEGRTWTALPAPPESTGTDAYVTGTLDVVIDQLSVSVLRGGAWTESLSTGGGLSEGGFHSDRLGYCIGVFGDGADQTMRVSRDAGRTWQDVRF